MRALLVLVLAASLLSTAAIAQGSAAQVAVAEPAKPLGAESKCLALAVYWEGKTETREGQLAVAHTVLNRKKNPKFPKTICGVVSQKAAGGKKGCQFSWWCDGKRDEPTEDENWKEAVESTRLAMQAGAKDPTNGALYFHSAKIKPPAWAKKRKALGRIGDHIFYR
jgi:N-acetylmuramoyl-L-alanine amidase